MLNLVVEALDVVLGGSLGSRWYERGRRRRVAVAFAHGRDAAFPGWLLGQQSYCRAAGGLLVVTEPALDHVVDRGMPMTRHDVPIDRIAGFTVRPGTPADHKQMTADWMVLEFLDEAAPVRIACGQQEMRYVEHAINRTLSPPRS